MKCKLSELIKLFDNPEVSGPADVEIVGIAALDKAGKNELTFLGNKKYASEVPSTKASAVILPRSYKGELPEGAAVVRVDNPSMALGKICALIEKELYSKPHPSIHPTSVIDRNAKVSRNSYIGPNVVVCEGAEIAEGCALYGNNYIGRGVKIGEDCVLMPNSVVLDRCILGKRVRLQPGAVIGSDGYGYEFIDGRHVRIPQVGIVVLEDDVDIGANTCIDRARFDTTRVGAGTKIDNLVQIAHNVQIGQGALLVSQVGISGSTKIGNYAVLGGQTGVAGHINIGDGAMIGGQSGVNGNIPPKSYMRGTPPRPYMHAHKIEVLIDKLPDFFDRLKDVEKALNIEKKTFAK